MRRAIITSLTGIGDVLGAEFLDATGGSLAGFASADHRARYAGLAAAPDDSDCRTGTYAGPSDTTDNCNASSTPRP